MRKDMTCTQELSAYQLFITFKTAELNSLYTPLFPTRRSHCCPVESRFLALAGRRPEILPHLQTSNANTTSTIPLFWDFLLREQTVRMDRDWLLEGFDCGYSPTDRDTARPQVHAQYGMDMYLGGHREELKGKRPFIFASRPLPSGLPQDYNQNVIDDNGSYAIQGVGQVPHGVDRRRECRKEASKQYQRSPERR
jgi:hypothetical protein